MFRRTDPEALQLVERDLALAHQAAIAASGQRELLLATVHAQDDGVVVVGADGSELVRNRAAERFRGARHGDAVVERTVDDMLRRARAGETAEQELQLFGPPRERFHVRGVPLRADGAVVGAAVLIRDVSELYRVQNVRRDFVANVSHELKTPIGAIEVLAETLVSCGDAEVANRLALQLAREADRLGRIVDDLLDLSLLEAQEVSSFEETRARLLVERAVDRVRPLALSRGIPLETHEIDDDLVIACDPRQLVGAVTNLLDNAVKYSEAGQPVEVSVTAADGTVVISVVDHGIGIPSSDLERVFERFYRVDKARSRSTGGTGLGLSIVRHVAQAHGGEVHAQSREGEGSEFLLVLPRSRPSTTDIEGDAEESW